MDPEKVRELVDKILSASMQELFDILLRLDLNNCPGEVVVAWHLRHQEICETCVSWYECNGVDRENCPLCQE